MSKYDKYLERMIGELEEKQKEIERLESPGQKLNRMREYYTKAERTHNYFSKYRDKGSGGENYRDFLSAKGKYLNRYDPWDKEKKVITNFEKSFFGNRKFWTRRDWAVYEKYISGLDYSWTGFVAQRW